MEELKVSDVLTLLLEKDEAPTTPKTIDQDNLLKDFLYKCTPITAESYRQSIMENHSCKLFGEDTDFIFDRLQQEVNKGSIRPSIKIQWQSGGYLSIDSDIHRGDGTKIYIPIRSTTIPFLRYLGYVVDVGRSSMNAFLHIYPFGYGNS